MLERTKIYMSDIQLTAIEKLVLIYLSEIGGTTNKNNTKLGHEIGMSHQTAQRAILGLHDKGYIEKNVNSVRYRGSGHLTKIRSITLKNPPKYELKTEEKGEYEAIV